ncbi:hypothetical protein HH310_23535 [Actinoplanes sp. TBRC 11911]|nr:hypothetical protein [Actinoplanes sp. TBRC 11911]
MLGAVALLTLAGCNNRGKLDTDPLPPIQQVEQPAASAGGACILWDYSFINDKIGVTFDVAAADQVDDTSICVVQTVDAQWPDLSISIVERTQANAKQFLDDLKPAKATTLKGLGQAGYRLNSPASGGHGPVVEIGWLSQAKQLQTLRFTFAKTAQAADVTTMDDNLLELAKAMDTTT